jgi:hypothetical protein
MEAPDQESLQPWVSRWDDLMDFEIVPILTSSDFWSVGARCGYTEAVTTSVPRIAV